MLPVEIPPQMTVEAPQQTQQDPREQADLPRLRRMFEQWRDLTANARQEAQKDDDYYHGNQLTAEEKTALAARGQPDIVINRTRAAINGILGVLDRGRTDPRAYPREPGDDDASDAATDALRYVGDKNRFSKTKVRAFRDMLVPGTCAAIVEMGEENDVQIRRIRFEEFIHDPKSREEDFSDARFLGIAKWMYADDLAAIFPNDKDAINAAANGLALSDNLLRDRPDGLYWVDKKERRLMVVEMYHRDQTWMHCVFVASKALVYEESPYKDDKGRPTCPIVAMSSYVDKDNNRIGAVRDMRGPQDEINKRRSKLLHVINVSQIQAVDPSAMGVSAEDARKEAARPDGVLPYGWQKVQTSDFASGQALLLQEAKGEMERLGPNPAVVGREGAGASGRALQARTQAGMIELAILFGALEDWELRIWRQCWSRVKQFWRSPQWLRVTGDNEEPKYVGINMPKGPMSPMADPQTGQPMMGTDGQPQTQEGQPVVDPQTGQSAFGYKNQVAEMDVDIILDTTPDTANIQAEQFDSLAQLIASNPMYAQQVPFSMVLEMSSVPHKRRFLKQIKENADQQGRAQQQQMQQQVQMMGDKLQAEIEKLRSEAGLNVAKTQTETFNAQVDAHEKAAYTGLAMHEAMNPPPGSTGVSGASQPQ